MVTEVHLATTGASITSVGDIAIAMATTQSLVTRGVAVYETCRKPVLSQKPTLVIGGGHILPQERGCRNGLYDQFLVKGKHILNSVGVRVHELQNHSWEYLENYRYLSVRDVPSFESIRKHVPAKEIYLTPCPATLLKPMEFEEMVKLPDFEWLEQEQNYVLIHPVDNLRLMRNIPGDAIAIETQPWLQRVSNSRWRSVPYTHSPEVLASVVSRASMVITRSLHLAIFAISNGIPFCCHTLKQDAQTEKLKSYFQRARFTQCLYEGDNPVEYIQKNISKKQVEELRDRETIECDTHFDRMVQSLGH